MAETTVVIKEVKSLKSGSSNKGPWNLYGVLDGNDEVVATTFSDTLFNQAKELEGQRAMVVYEESEKGKSLQAVKPAPADSNGALAPGVRSATPKDDQTAINAREAYRLAVEAYEDSPLAATPKQLEEKLSPLAMAIFIWLQNRCGAPVADSDSIPF